MSKLLDNVRNVMRVRHYSYQTEKTYLHWIRQFIFFNKITHPAEMGAAEVEAFLTHLAVERNVAASTQNQALAVLLFLYKEVLNIDLSWLDKFTPAKKSNHLPVVLTKQEVGLIISQLSGTNWLIANLHYGSGLRLIEALRLRVKDFGFRVSANRRSQRQRRQRPLYGFAEYFNRTAAKAVKNGWKTARAGFTKRSRTRRYAVRAFEKISGRGKGMGVAICFPVEKFERQSADRTNRQNSRVAVEPAKTV
jgi:site-specific recombinase XerD